MNQLARHSLTGRLLLASLLVVPVFLGGTGWFLERSYKLSLESAIEERLKLQVLTLMAETEFDSTLRMPPEVLEPRFNQVNSGLIGLVSGADGGVLWRSTSSIASSGEFLTTGPQQTRAGQDGFTRSETLYRYWLSVLWQTDSGTDTPLVFTVMESTAPMQAQLASLRSSLFLWLGGTTLVLLALQTMILLWGLRPLRELATDIARIEAGERERLEGDYPSEVEPLTQNLNSLLQAEQQRRERTRNTLADLAHSLKTPLAVIRSADGNDPDFAQLVNEQSQHMDQIVAYQLQRASSGAHTLLRLVPILEIAQRLQHSFEKVYAEKSPHFALHIAKDSRFRGDERDLMELLGSLMDNACKYGLGEVRVTAKGSDTRLEITVEDDGPGVPIEATERVLDRGVRADRTTPGQGIGLAVAADIASSYGGSMAIGSSDLGGARITVAFDAP